MRNVNGNAPSDLPRRGELRFLKGRLSTSTDRVVLIVSSDDLNEAGANPIVMDVSDVFKGSNPHAVRLSERDPMTGTHVLAHTIAWVSADRIRDSLGMITGATLAQVDSALRAALDMP